MKTAIYAVGSLLSLFIAMFSALNLLALKATETFEGAIPPVARIFILEAAAAGFLALAILLLVLTFRDLGAHPSRGPS